MVFISVITHRTKMLLLIISLFFIMNSMSYRYITIKSSFKYPFSYKNICFSTSNDEQVPEISKQVSNSKGFGTVKKGEVEVVEKDIGTKTYENQAKRGVPEYNIFLRPTNGTEVEWVPVGSMTIPRDTKVSKAVYEVEEELLRGSFKLYPKLKAFYDVRVDKTGMFEYGYCLKAFPDEPIIVITKEEEQSKNFFGNWLNRLTNPIDTTKLNNPGQMTIKQ